MNTFIITIIAAIVASNVIASEHYDKSSKAPSRRDEGIDRAAAFARITIATPTHRSPTKPRKPNAKPKKKQHKEENPRDKPSKKKSDNKRPRKKKKPSKKRPNKKKPNKKDSSNDEPTTRTSTTSTIGSTTSTSNSSSSRNTSAATAVEEILEKSKDGIDNNILLYQTPSYQWEPSTVYRYSDFLDALRVMYKDGIANKFFFIGDDSPNGFKYGLVNIAAFLAQSMKETIQYNACDENSWDLVNGVYPISNACGQLGQSYQDYKCSAEEAHMECPVNPNMKIKATTHAKWYGAPAPLFCAPKTDYPFTGSWNYLYQCNKPWANPPEYCNEYDGQKAGAFNNDSPVPNSSGRTDVEGCCFWGRGVIQTTGVCNFGKLNYYLGSRAAEEGREARYPEINFCEQPDAICASEEHKELKWIAGMFYWVESLQSYSVDGWDYIIELKKYVDNGMVGASFIDAVSGIVNRGCHNPPCKTGDVDGKADRSTNFYKVLAEFDI